MSQLHHRALLERDQQLQNLLLQHYPGVILQSLSAHPHHVNYAPKCHISMALEHPRDSAIPWAACTSAWLLVKYNVIHFLPVSCRIHRVFTARSATRRYGRQKGLGHGSSGCFTLHLCTETLQKEDARWFYRSFLLLTGIGGAN